MSNFNCPTCGRFGKKINRIDNDEVSLILLNCHGIYARTYSYTFTVDGSLEIVINKIDEGSDYWKELINGQNE